MIYVTYDAINTKSQSQVVWKWMSQPQHPKVLRKLEVLSEISGYTAALGVLGDRFGSHCS